MKPPKKNVYLFMPRFRLNTHLCQKKEFEHYYWKIYTIHSINSQAQVHESLRNTAGWSGKKRGSCPFALGGLLFPLNLF